MEENEYRKINNDDKKEFLLNKEEEKNETPDDFKKIDDNNNNEKFLNNNNSSEEENEMDDSKFGFKYDAYKESNIFSRLFFFWAFYILRLATKTKLNQKYFGSLNKESDSTNFKKEIYKIWEGKEYNKIESNALFKTIIRVNIKQIFIIFILSAYNAFGEIIQIIILKGYIDHFETGKPFFGITKLLYLGLIIIIFQFIGVYMNLHNQMKQQALGIKSSFQLQSLIFHKLLKVSPSSFIQKATQGEIINFIQVDSEKIEWIIQDAPGLFINPIKIIVYIIMLFNYFGISFLAGLITLIILVSINAKIFSAYNKIQQEYLKKKDSRMKITTETFDNIKILKLYNWENKFRNKIIEKREEEISELNNYIIIDILNITIFWLSPVLVSVITIGLYQYLHKSFQISVLLMGLAIFSSIQDPIRYIPALINGLIDAKNSLNRIEKFIRQPEIEEKNLIQCDFDEKKDYSIKIENAYFSWGVKQKKNEDEDNKERNKDEKIKGEKLDKEKEILSQGKKKKMIKKNIYF